MSQPLVSVIIPVYNSTEFITACVKSVLDQTWKNIEIIIINDGSIDGSMEKIENLNIKELKIFHQENKGASAARNMGIKLAKGEFIQFLDADDLISSNKIENQMNILNANPNSVCGSSSVYFFENENPYQKKIIPPYASKTYYTPLEFILKLLGGKNGGMMMLHSWLTPKSVIKKAGFWNENLSVDDDGEYFVRVILHSESVINCVDAIAYYRKHLNQSNLSAQLTVQAYHSMLRATILKFEQLSPFISNHPELNNIFLREFHRIAVASYPQYKSISAEALSISYKIKKVNPSYHGGSISTFIGKIIGWRLIRKINYYRFGH